MVWSSARNSRKTRRSILTVLLYDVASKFNESLPWIPNVLKFDIGSIQPVFSTLLDDHFFRCRKITIWNLGYLTFGK